MTEYSMNSLNVFTSNFLSVIADENFTKKSDSVVQQRLIAEKPNNFTSLTPIGRVLISNPSGNIKTSDTDASALNNMKGVQSDIQQQIDNIPTSLLESSNNIENKLNIMTDKVSQHHNYISSNLEIQKNALQMDTIPEGEVHKLFKYGNYYNSLTVDGTVAAASYRIKGSITISGAVQENYNTESIEIVNELNAPAMKVVNNISSNILSVNYGTSGEDKRVTVLSNGNVGIGIAEPQEKLHVDGNIKVAGTINGVSQNDIENFKNVTGNIQQQLDNIGSGISDLSLNINDTFGVNDLNTSNYVRQTRDDLFNKISVMETAVSNYVNTEFDTLMDGKQNKITFGDGFSYDSEDNTLTVSTTNTLWNENVETNSISYSNISIYGDKIEINNQEVATIAIANRKLNTITGAASTIVASDLPFNRVLVTNTEGKVVASDIETSQINYLTNVTQPIQPQLDSISSDITATSSEFLTLINTSVANASNYTANTKLELQGVVNDLYEPLTFGTGLVYDDATKTLSTDGTFIYQGTVTTSDSVWSSNEDYVNYGEIKIYKDHVKVQDKQIATNLDFLAKQDKIVFPENVYNNENTISLAPSVWEDKGHYIRYKNTRIYNNRVTVGIDDTVDVKKYPPIGLPGITGSEQSGVVKTISGHTYGNGSYKVEWSSDTGEHKPSLLFNGNQNEGAGAHTGAFYNSNGEIIPYSGSSYHYLVSDYYGEWISLEFPERIYFTFIKLHPRRAYPYVSPKDYKVYGQNNDLTWDEILHVSDAIYSNNVHVSGHYSPKKSYKKYGLVVNKVFSPGTILNFSEIEFFGIPDETLYVTTDEFAEDTTDMLAWYKFDGVNGEIDSSGNDKTATVTGNPVPSENLLSITKDNYLKLPNDIIDFEKDICISFWYRFDNEDMMARIFSFAKDTNIMSHANKILLSRNGIGEEFEFIVDANKATINFGHITGGDLIHVTWVIKKDGTWIIYKNGVQIYNTVHIYPLANTYTHSYLGKSNWAGEFNDDNQITMRDLRFYNRALTSEEVRVLYRVGKPVLYDFFADTSDMLAWYKFDGDLTDSSGNGKQLTGGTGTTFVDDKVIGTNSISFPNTTTQYLSSTVDLSGNTSFSISFWIYRKSNEIQFLMGVGAIGSINENMQVRMRDDYISFSFWGIGVQTPSTDADMNKWIHWTMQYDSSDEPNTSLSIYKNGVLMNTAKYPGNITNFPANTLTIGRLDVYSTQYQYNGKLDDVRIYNRALTPDEVHTLYAKSSMSSDGTVELHTMKADQLMCASGSSSAIKIGKHVQMRSIEATTESLSSRVVNSDTDIVETRENPYAMKLEKDLWMDGAGIIWTSDERIKKEIVDIDDNVALQQILAIEPKTYKYIDDATKGDATVYGFISQQIEEVIPEATKKTSRYIPNIYQSGEYNSSNNTIRMSGNLDVSRLNTLMADKFTSNYDDMSSNIVIKNENHLSTKLKVIDEFNNEVMLQYSLASDTSDEDGYELQIHNLDFTQHTSSNIFVYGTEINDLTTLDKSYIYTLNTCATQELSRKVDSLRFTNDTLLGYIESLEYRISFIRDYLSSNIDM